MLKLDSLLNIELLMFTLEDKCELLSNLCGNSIKLFSNNVIKGTKTKKYEKYITVEICPNSINGDSTCLAPNSINIRKLPTKIKKAILLKGLNCIPLDLDTSVNGIINKIKIA